MFNPSMPSHKDWMDESDDGFQVLRPDFAAFVFIVGLLVAAVVLR